MSSVLKKIFSPKFGVGFRFQILDILLYACGFKSESALTLNQNLFFENAWNKFRQALLFIIMAVTVISLNSPAVAERVSAEAVVEKSSVFVGESIAFQIRISGSEKPEKPDLPKLNGGILEYQGGQQNSSSSITIINGKMTKNVQAGYVFSYQLTPTKPGTLVIPQIIIHAEGNRIATRPVVLKVQKPVETDDFKLRVRFSKDSCYVGEPVVMEFTWYMAKDVRNLSIMMPLLESDQFALADPRIDTNDGNKYYRIPFGTGEAIGKMGKGRLDGRGYSTLTIRKIVIPRKPGTLMIQPATGVAEVLAGYRQQKSPFADDFFSDFFKNDFFMKGRSGVYQKIVVPSNPLELNISALPDKGRPQNFSGLVGEYRITAAASPVEASVGDPITLKVIVRGPAYLEDVDMPPLDRQPDLAAAFKIPKERAVGELTDNGKVFTQTIRAKRSGIDQIPAIELPYFDTKSGQYKTARSEPIPVTIKKARVVTAQDAEGLGGPLQSNGNRVESWSSGIAYNYEDLGVIEKEKAGLEQWFRSPAWLVMMGFPPFLFCVLAAFIVIRKKRLADPMGQRSRKAFPILEKQLRPMQQSRQTDISAAEILEIFRTFLGDKLGLPGGAITYNDVEEQLLSRGVEPETMEQLKKFFHQCEAESYAGGAGGIGSKELAGMALDAARRLEEII